VWYIRKTKDVSLIEPNKVDLGANSLDRLTVYIKRGEFTQRKVIKLVQPHPHISQENVRCLMGYIVDLIVILGDISRATAGYVSTIDALAALDRHVEQGWKDKIHQDIYRFVSETFMTSSNAVPQRDLVLEKIIALIKQYCPAPFPEADAERDAELVVVPVQEAAVQEEITLIISVG
jgi:hypothetical protein